MKKFMTALIAGAMALSAMSFSALAADEKYEVTDAASLKTAMEAINTAGSGSTVTINILNDIDAAAYDGVSWDSYSSSGADYIVINGNNYALTNMTDMLFTGTWTGNSLTINDLTIKDAKIVVDAEDATETVGVGAVIGNMSCTENINLNNVKVVDSYVEGGHWTGGLIGYAAGFSEQDNGPVFSTITVNGCSVTDSEVTGKGSVGGFFGHAMGDAWTKVEVTGSEVSGNTITSTGDSTIKAGSICGTIGAGGKDTVIAGLAGGLYVDATVTKNTVTSNGTEITTIYGRQGSATGTLEVTGGSYEYNPVAAGDAFATIKNDITGEGTVEDPYVISNIKDFKWFRDDVNNGNTYKGKYVTLATDIDLANEEWTPIGNSTNTFQGNFDGGNHTISNLLITGNNKDVGLFGFTTNGTVKNLTINNADVSGFLDVGVVAGSPYTSKYDNITLTGDINVKGYAYVGGMFGKNAYADLSNLTINANEGSKVVAESENYRTYVGGVVGFMGEGSHTVSNVTSNIDVYGSTIDVGGITGIAHYGNTFENCISTGDVTVTSYPDDGDQLESGGIAGVWHNGGAPVTFTDCYFEGTLSAVKADGTVYEGPFANAGLFGKAYSATGTGVLVVNNKVAEINGEKYETLQAALEAAASMTGDVTIELIGDVEWETGASHGSTPLIPAGASVGNVTIVGNGSTKLTATGAGVGPLRDANGGTLTFKDLVIEDKSVSYAESAWEFTYLEFAGNLKFENVDFKSGIMLGADDGNSPVLNAEFVECSFLSEADSEYSVWCGHGTVTFTECDFTGTRALKVNEAYGSEVDAVTVDKCTFTDIAKKPAVVFGDLNADTDIAITNCTVTNVTAGDQNVYLYESDTDVSNFDLTVTGTTVTVNDAKVWPIASIGDKQYGSLQAAVNAANADDTITLVADKVIEEGSVTIDKSVKFVGKENLASEITNTAFVVKAPVAFDGIKFTGNSYINVAANTAESVTVENCDVNVNLTEKKSGRAAFLVAPTENYSVKIVMKKNNVVVNSTVDAYPAAVFTWTNTADGSEISENTFGDADNRYKFIAVKLMNADDGATVTISDNKVYGTSDIWYFYAFDFYQNTSRENTYTVLSSNNVIDATLGQYGAYAFCIEANTAGFGPGNAIVYDNGTTFNGGAVTFENFDIQSDAHINLGINVELDENEKIKAGTFENDPTAYLAEGYEAIDYNGKYLVVEDVSDAIRVNFVPVSASDEEIVYNIVLETTDGVAINRFNSADLTFANNSDEGVVYSVLASNSEIAVYPAVDNNGEVIADRYEFHYTGKDNVTTDTAASIVIGKVVFTGIGAVNFGVADATTNVAHATTAINNIVTDFVPGGATNKGTLKTDVTISGVELKKPEATLTINVSFPNNVEANAYAYQNMEITIEGAEVDYKETIELGEALNDNKYVIEKTLTANTPYQVTVTGDGYRTARYTVVLTEDKTLNFWNNLMDADKQINVEESASGSKNPQRSTFLAGDIVKDNDINLYDLSAVVSYFGKTGMTASEADYIQYDLNRDGDIDSKDIAMVLVSWED